MKALLGLLILLMPCAVGAQEPRISLSQAECLPASGNGLLTATVESEPPGATLRFYFRRLHAEAEDFYYVVGRPRGGGHYHAALPKPADERLVTPADRAHWASWWRARNDSPQRGERAEIGQLEKRDWLEALDGQELQVWLEGLENEPVEYYAILFDATGEEVAWSDRMLVVDVRNECPVDLDDHQRGEADNLIVGETANWQAKEQPFHWQCEGLVTRIDPDGIFKADRYCRDTFLSVFEDLAEEERTAGRALLTGPSGSQPYRTVKVFYGTDRKRLPFSGASWQRDSDNQGAAAYAGARGNAGQLEVGTCEVSIPLDHTRGVTETPGIFERADPARHVLLLKVTPESQPAFIADLKSEIAASSAKAALVFIHGYNVSFEDAARRTAQIAYDLEFAGAPVMYSWPSQAELKGYTVDEANIRWTVPHLERFLQLVTGQSGAEEVHVIAHSMGNRAFTEVLRRFAAESRPNAPRFNQIALVAPDVDADVFRQEIAPAVRCVSGRCVGDRVTLYASKRDKALLASKQLHGHPRAGDLSEGMVVARGIDTIDASDVDTSLLSVISLGHSYFADKPSVISDLAQKLLGKNPSGAERASRLSPRSSEDGRYWVLKPER